MAKAGDRKILAMDLSLNLPAFCVAEVKDGIFRVVELYHVNNSRPAGQTHAQKLQNINKVLIEIANKHTDLTDLCREKGFSRYTTVTQTLFKVVGVSDLAGVNYYGVKDIVEYPPTSVKTLIAGSGRAGKDEVEAGVREMLQPDQKDISFYSDDESDAVAVALTHCIKKGYLK